MVAQLLNMQKPVRSIEAGAGRDARDYLQGWGYEVVHVCSGLLRYVQTKAYSILSVERSSSDASAVSSDISAVTYQAQVPNTRVFPPQSASTVTDGGKAFSLCATAAIQSQHEWLFIQKVDSRSGALSYSWMLQRCWTLFAAFARPHLKKSKLTIREHPVWKGPCQVLVLCSRMGNLSLLMKQSHWFYFAVAFC